MIFILSKGNSHNLEILFKILFLNFLSLGLSVITDLGVEGIVEEVSHEAVQQAAKKAEKIVAKLIKQFISTY